MRVSEDVSQTSVTARCAAVKNSILSALYGHDKPTLASEIAQSTATLGLMCFNLHNKSNSHQKAKKLHKYLNQEQQAKMSK